MNTRLLFITGLLAAFASGLFVGWRYPDVVTALLLLIILLVLILTTEAVGLWPRTRRKAVKPLPASRASRGGRRVL